eukprot:1387564-Amorphochlora_amoeboformis.AAC.2
MKIRVQQGTLKRRRRYIGNTGYEKTGSGRNSYPFSFPPQVQLTWASFPANPPSRSVATRPDL